MSSIKITLPLAFVLRQSPPPTPLAITTDAPPDTFEPATASSATEEGLLGKAGRLLGGLITTLTDTRSDRWGPHDRGLLGDITLGATMDPPGKDADGVFRARLSLDLGIHLLAAWPQPAQAPVPTPDQGERAPAIAPPLIQAN